MTDFAHWWFRNVYFWMRTLSKHHTVRFNDTYRVPFRVNMIQSIILHVTCHPFLHPKIVPPFTCHQITEPLFEIKTNKIRYPENLNLKEIITTFSIHQIFTINRLSISLVHVLVTSRYLEYFKGLFTPYMRFIFNELMMAKAWNY